MTIDPHHACGPERTDHRMSEFHRDLVRRAEALALAEFDGSFRISALCRALGVSDRTLRKAFNKAYGEPPSRHLRLLRLSLARGALLSTRGKAVTVTEVATGFGFVELGRFSVEYRKIFGESPSSTRLRSSRSNLSQQPCQVRAE
jgi:transcriptional regulator GlxA family with amidase domain